MQKYRKLPVEIEAIQWTGENTDDVVEFVDGKPPQPYSMGDSGLWLKQKVFPDDHEHAGKALWFLVIPTLEGDHEAAVGDWIIKGVQGEFYPCKPDIFEQTYEIA